MTRRSKRELESALDDVAGDVPEEPPHEWLAVVPREYWDDEVEALRQFWRIVEEATDEDTEASA